jgi:hypothetical protein
MKLLPSPANEASAGEVIRMKLLLARASDQGEAAAV